MERVYLPRTLLARHGITEIRADDRAQWPKLHAAALELLELAEAYYASAYHGMAELPPRSAWAIGAARRVYRAIGQKLRSGGPDAWEHRVSTSRNEKLMLLAKSLGDVAWTRLPRQQPDRAGLWKRPA
jgi:phytoene synthase